MNKQPFSATVTKPGIFLHATDHGMVHAKGYALKIQGSQHSWFLYYNRNARGWYVCEESTGLALNSGGLSKEEALRESLFLLNAAGESRVAKAVENHRVKLAELPAA
jgi:hypothetical protein